MTLTSEQAKKLEENCIAIREYLKDLVKDCDTAITLEVDFFRPRDHHPLGIRVRKYTNGKVDVYGYIGGLGIQFEGERDYNHTLAWDYTDYGIELISQWSKIKSEFNSKLNEELRTKKGIMDFVL